VNKEIWEENDEVNEEEGIIQNINRTRKLKKKGRNLKYTIDKKRKFGFAYFWKYRKT